MTLVENARQAWRWFSVQALAAIAIIETLWLSLPPETVALIPAEWKAGIVTFLAVAGAIGRLVKQGEA